MSGSTRVIRYIYVLYTVEALLMDTAVSGHCSTYCCLHKTPFFSSPVQTPYFYRNSAKRPAISYGHLFRVPKVSAYESFHVL